MVGIKINDKVMLEGKSGRIGGIHNYPTKEAIEFYFGKDFKLQFDTLLPFHKFFGKDLIGKIVAIGKHNMFAIETSEKLYLFCNDYCEMKKLEKEDNPQGRHIPK